MLGWCCNLMTLLCHSIIHLMTAIPPELLSFLWSVKRDEHDFLVLVACNKYVKVNVNVITSEYLHVQNTIISYSDNNNNNIYLKSNIHSITRFYIVSRLYKNINWCTPSIS